MTGDRFEPTKCGSRGENLRFRAPSGGPATREARSDTPPGARRGPRRGLREPRAWSDASAEGHARTGTARARKCRSWAFSRETWTANGQAECVSNDERARVHKNITRLALFIAHPPLAIRARQTRERCVSQLVRGSRREVRSTDTGRIERSGRVAAFPGNAARSGCHFVRRLEKACLAPFVHGGVCRRDPHAKRGGHALLGFGFSTPTPKPSN